MKRVFALFLTAIITLLCVSCAAQETSKFVENKPTAEHNLVITNAVSTLKKYWKNEYDQSKVETDGYFEIKNTRILTLKDNDIELFDNVKYIIEFELYTDYFASAPYYENVGINNNVIVYKSGKMDVKNSLIRMYRSKTYQADYSDFIESIDDYHGYYNCVETLK